MQLCRSGLLVLLGLELLGAAGASSLPPDASFIEFNDLFGRTYLQDSSEYSQRLALFQERSKAARAQNAKPGALWVAALNKFADRTQAEMSTLMGWRPSRRAAVGQLGLVQATGGGDRASTEKPVDWAHLESLSHVLDQSSCGSCWAVASSNMLSAHYEIATGHARRFSPQQFVDCVPNPEECGGKGGCQGATVELAMKYVHDTGLENMSTLDDMPYTGTQGQCGHGNSDLMALSANLRGVRKHYELGVQAQFIGFHTLPSNERQPLLEALQKGPTAVSVAGSSWSSYNHGVFDGCEHDWVVNHAVVAIGYGSENGVHFFKLRNSWGGDWGEEGNIRIKRRGPDEEEECGDDNRPEDGVECKPYPDKVRVCGQCGVLYDSVSPSLQL